MSEEKKYINVNGILRINPNYVEKGKPHTILNQNALTVVSVASDLAEYNIRAPRPLLNTFDTIQTKAYTDNFNPSIDGGEILDQLGHIFNQYEIPIGLTGHLIQLQKYSLHFKIDDSGSMSSSSNLAYENLSPYMMNIVNANISRAGNVSRWVEAEDRIHILIHLLAYVPIANMKFSFLNASQELYLSNIGKMPEMFIQEAHEKVRNLFATNHPNNGTPLLRAMESMIRNARGPTMHYVITDGCPSGGAREIESIELLLKNGRGSNMWMNPVTFMSCSNTPTDTEWIHETEECSPMIAALNDFKTEQQEVLNDQGPIFPYSRGLWLLANLVAALDPNGLDAMDQHAPLTKSIVDNLLGRVHSNEEYRLYFTNHPTYVGGLITRTNSYYRHLTRVFEPDYEFFLQEQFESNIPSVVFFKKQLGLLLDKDMENLDDNSEAREILNVEKMLVNARRNRKFDAGNRVLQQREQQFMQNVVRVEAVPVAVPFSVSDYYSYPTFQPTPSYFSSFSSKQSSSYTTGGTTLPPVNPYYADPSAPPSLASNSNNNNNASYNNRNNNVRRKSSGDCIIC